MNSYGTCNESCEQRQCLQISTISTRRQYFCTMCSGCELAYCPQVCPLRYTSFIAELSCERVHMLWPVPALHPDNYCYIYSSKWEPRTGVIIGWSRGNGVRRERGRKQEHHWERKWKRREEEGRRALQGLSDGGLVWTEQHQRVESELSVSLHSFHWQELRKTSKEKEWLLSVCLSVQ